MNTETGTPLWHLYPLRLRHCLGCLDDEKIFVPLPVFSLIFSPASPRYSEGGLLTSSCCAGSENYKVTCTYEFWSGSTRWFRVSWFESIDYSIKKWPIQPHTTCLICVLAPCKGIFEQPYVLYSGSRHLSTGSVSSWEVFLRFGWFCFYYFCFILFCIFLSLSLYPFRSPIHHYFYKNRCEFH